MGEANLDLLDIGCEEGEGGQCGRTDGKALSGGCRSVAEGIQDICLLAYLRIESAHLGVSSGIVRYRTVCIRGERDAEG